jgi:hypothetical protein
MILMQALAKPKAMQPLRFLGVIVLLAFVL